jgi:hypothetical protein
MSAGLRNFYDILASAAAGNEPALADNQINIYFLENWIKV